MPRRLLLPLLSALALLLAAAPAALAAPAAAPAAHAAADDDSICADGEAAVESDDGTVECGGDEVLDDGSGDVDALCDDDWGDEGSDDWGDDSGDETEAEIAADDDCDETLAAPVLSKLSAKVAGRGRAARLTVAFTLDVPGEVELTLQRTEAGTTSGKRCVGGAAKKAVKGKAAKGRGGKKGKRCSRTVPLSGTVAVDGDAGANSFAVAKWKGRGLKPGSYRLTATPADDGGRDVTATFTVAAR